MSGRPYGVHTVRSMYQSGDVKTMIGNQWVVAVAPPHRGNILERLRAAWWVFKGHAEAVIWPIAGEIDPVFFGASKGIARAPVFAVLEFAGDEPGRENEMPRVLSCKWMPDGRYNVYLSEAD